MAFYISAATLSSLGSHLFTILVGRLALPSLGASGAIFSLFAATAAIYPDMGVRVLFLPWRFELGEVLPVFVILDIVGLLRGWSFFDHAAVSKSSGVRMSNPESDCLSFESYSISPGWPLDICMPNMVLNYSMICWTILESDAIVVNIRSLSQF